MPNIERIEVYVKIGEGIYRIGKAAYDAIRGAVATDAEDDATLARLDALYAARLDQAKKDAGGA